MRFIVAYDLNRPGQGYAALWNELERLGGHRVLESTWSIDVDSSTCADVRNHFAQYLDRSDGLFVMKLGNWATGGVAKNPDPQ